MGLFCIFAVRNEKDLRMKRLKFIYPRVIKPVTGGHRYEKSLRDVLSASGFDIQTMSNIPSERKLSVLNKIFSPIIALKFLKNIDSKRDIIVFNSTTGLYFLLLVFILKFLNVKTVIIHHHYLYKEFSGLKKILYHTVENLFLRSASVIITPSPYIKELIAIEISKESLLLPIPFNRPDLESRPKTVRGQLLYIGTIEKRKGLDMLIESLHLLESPHKYVLHIVGKTRDPQYKEFLDTMIRRYNLNVVFHGFVTDQQLNDIIGSSDIFVFPSLLEGFGMAINEVKFFGLPVVCFNNSAMPFSTTDGEDGFVVKNKDINEFSKAIERIVKDRNIRNEMSRKALLKASKLYTNERFREDSVTLFTNLLH